MHMEYILYCTNERARIGIQCWHFNMTQQPGIISFHRISPTNAIISSTFPTCIQYYLLISISHGFVYCVCVGFLCLSNVLLFVSLANANAMLLTTDYWLLTVLICGVYIQYVCIWHSESRRRDQKFVVLLWLMAFDTANSFKLRASGEPDINIFIQFCILFVFMQWAIETVT